MLASDAGLAIDILADILTDSVFDKDELEREKEVILQEIGAVEDTPDDLVFDLFNAAAFPEQPIGWPILGTPEHVQAFDRSMISNYLAKQYRSGVTTIGAAGALDHAQIVDAAASRFANMAAQVGEAVTPARYLGGDTRLSRRLEQAHVVIGFEGLSYAAPGYYALQVSPMRSAAACLRGFSKRFARIAGLPIRSIPFIGAMPIPASSASMARQASAQVRELVPVALECLAKAAEDLSEAEIDRATAQMKVSQLTALESSTARSEQIARQILAYGRVLSRDEILARIDNLTVNEIRAAGAAALRTVAGRWLPSGPWPRSIRRIASRELVGRA